MREIIRGNQRQSEGSSDRGAQRRRELMREIIRGNQRQSEAIRGNQRVRQTEEPKEEERPLMDLARCNPGEDRRHQREADGDHREDDPSGLPAETDRLRKSAHDSAIARGRGERARRGECTQAIAYSRVQSRWQSRRTSTDLREREGEREREGRPRNLGCNLGGNLGAPVWSTRAGRRARSPR